MDFFTSLPFETFLQITVATILGMILGIERLLAGRTAGPRNSLPDPASEPAIALLEEKPGKAACEPRPEWDRVPRGKDFRAQYG